MVGRDECAYVDFTEAAACSLYLLQLQAVFNPVNSSLQTTCLEVLFSQIGAIFNLTRHTRKQFLNSIESHFNGSNMYNELIASQKCYLECTNISNTDH